MAVPSLTMRVDWDGDGLTTGAQDNISSDVKRIRWSRGYPREFGGGTQFGSCTITVKNSSNKYDPDNGSSVLSGKLIPGKVGYAFATWQSVDYPLFGGLLQRIVLDGYKGEAHLTFFDVLRKAARKSVSKSGATDRSFKDFRDDVLVPAIVPSSAWYDLTPDEMDIMPFSGVGDQKALTVLEQLNAATGTRHFVRPGPSTSIPYQYVALSRHHKLEAAADESIPDVHDVEGWEVTDENLVTFQRATYTPFDFEGMTKQEVWRYPTLPLVLALGVTKLSKARFDRFRGVLRFQPEIDAEFVFEPEVEYEVTAGSATVTLTHNANAIEIEVIAGGGGATLSELRVIAYREPSATAEVTAGSGDYEGSTISSPFLRVEAQAQALADHIVYRLGSARKRPRIRVRNLFPTVLRREPGDVLSVSISKISVSNRRFEIVGLEGEALPEGPWEVAYDLQEPPSQSVVNYLNLDQDQLNQEVLGY